MFCVRREVSGIEINTMGYFTLLWHLFQGEKVVTVHSGSSPEPTVAGVILQTYNWKMTNIWSVEFCKATREHLGC